MARAILVRPIRLVGWVREIVIGAWVGAVGLLGVAKLGSIETTTCHCLTASVAGFVVLAGWGGRWVGAVYRLLADDRIGGGKMDNGSPPLAPVRKLKPQISQKLPLSASWGVLQSGQGCTEIAAVAVGVVLLVGFEPISAIPTPTIFAPHSEQKSDSVEL